MPTDGHAASLTGVVISTDEDLRRDFEQRLTESATLAFRIAYSVLRHHEDAEDVAQDAFSRAHRQFHRLRDRAAFRSWLTRMTWRLALDRRRADRRRARREAIDPPPPVRPEAIENLENRRRSEALWVAIDRLPEKLRMVIVLANIEEHGIAEVASLLSLPAGTVKSRLFEARQRLKEELSWMQTPPRT